MSKYTDFPNEAYVMKWFGTDSLEKYFLCIKDVFKITNCKKKKWKEILSRLNGGRQDENAAHIHTKLQ